MAVNVTVRDIVNYPGGTAKTVTVDIVQVVPKGAAEGDEVWVSSTTTSATASGTVAIESMYKNEMKRGFIKSSGLIQGSLLNIPSNARIVVSIDENIGSGLEIQLSEGNNLLGEDVAQDMENKIQSEAVIGGGGSKIGNLSYLNAQVRFQNGKFSIESGTAGASFTGASRSSVQVGAPALGTDIRATLGFDISLDSESLAGRQIVETDLTSGYTSGVVLTVRSTAGLSDGDAFVISDATNSDIALVSGTVVDELWFTAVSGLGLGLANAYATGAMVRKLHELDVSDPVSAITTVDQLYRFGIDSMVNQIDFSA